MKKIALSLAIAFVVTSLAAATIDITYSIALKRDNGKVVLDDPAKLEDLKAVTGSTPALVITCLTGVDCKHLKVTLGATEVAADPTPTAQLATYRLPVKDLKVDTATSLKIEITENNQTATVADKVDVFRRPQASPQQSSPSGEAGTVDEMKKNSCASYLKKHQKDIVGSYDEPKDRAVVYMLASGRMLTRPPEHFDDNDVLELHVIADEGFEDVTAIRTSPIDRREFHILGEEQRSEIHEQALIDRPCRDYTSTVSYFSAPTGEVQLQSGDQILLSFQFPVARRYWGMYSMGPVRSQLPHQSFKLVKQGDSNVIANDFAGKSDIQYALFITPFFGGKRDVEKPLDMLSPRRLNLSVGITLQHTADNLLIGGSYYIGGILFTAGRQWARVTVLDPASGLAPGKAFTGTAAEIPTVKKLNSDWYVGATLDLRAALGIFSTIGRAATP